jgi:hypothetical protein
MPMSYQDFLVMLSKKIRELQDTDFFSLTEQAKQSEYTVDNQRSGGVIPDFYMAHVDKYG